MNSSFICAPALAQHRAPGLAAQLKRSCHSAVCLSGCIGDAGPSCWWPAWNLGRSISALQRALNSPVFGTGVTELRQSSIIGQRNEAQHRAR